MSEELDSITDKITISRIFDLGGDSQFVSNTANMTGLDDPEDFCDKLAIHLKEFIDMCDIPVDIVIDKMYALVTEEDAAFFNLEENNIPPLAEVNAPISYPSEEGYQEFITNLKNETSENLRRLYIASLGIPSVN